MQTALLTIMKFGVILLLYLFLARVVKAVLLDLYGSQAAGRRRRAASRAPVASRDSGQGRRSRKLPREIVVHVPDGRPVTRALQGAAMVLGRAQGAAVILDDVYVSDEHAELLPEDGGWSVRDLGSTNGTFLNGAKVTRPTPLAAGDQLRLGKTTIEVRR